MLNLLRQGRGLHYHPKSVCKLIQLWKSILILSFNPIFYSCARLHMDHLAQPSACILNTIDLLSTKTFCCLHDFFELSISHYKLPTYYHILPYMLFQILGWFHLPLHWAASQNILVMVHGAAMATILAEGASWVGVVHHKSLQFVLFCFISACVCCYPTPILAAQKRANRKLERDIGNSQKNSKIGNNYPVVQVKFNIHVKQVD